MALSQSTAPRIDIQNLSLTPRIGEFLIAQSFPSGVPAGIWLFWRVGNAQRLAIISCLWQLSDARDIRYEAEHGMARNGLFAGVPYFLDPTLPETEIRLEVIDRGINVGSICRCALPIEYSRIESSSDKAGAE